MRCKLPLKNNPPQKNKIKINAKCYGFIEQKCGKWKSMEVLKNNRFDYYPK